MATHESPSSLAVWGRSPGGVVRAVRSKELDKAVRHVPLPSLGVCWGCAHHPRWSSCGRRRDPSRVGAPAPTRSHSPLASRGRKRSMARGSLSEHLRALSAHSQLAKPRSEEFDNEREAAFKHVRMPSDPTPRRPHDLAINVGVTPIDTNVARYKMPSFLCSIAALVGGQ
ncbi:hypothetical protein C8R45DRAFT_1115498 [Mycena sanguinolenta]|nr:hypothetical protein C8R45DRAFT_1115498 [Mycena sanguinolenta]